MAPNSEDSKTSDATSQLPPRNSQAQPPLLGDEAALVAAAGQIKLTEDEPEAAMARETGDEFSSVSFTENTIYIPKAARAFDPADPEILVEVIQRSPYSPNDHSSDCRPVTRADVSEYLGLNTRPIAEGSVKVIKQEKATEADLIVDQVEQYFSDENLQGDLFLLSKVRGRKNRPVPIDLIHGFNNIRGFQPFSAVVDALRQSKTLDVVRDRGKWCVQRKVPFIKDKPQEIGTTAPKKPKSKAKPTGLEEYYADAPVTPAEAAEEQSLYDPSYPFPQRIQTAIQRYRAKRRFETRVTKFFDKFMSYGGINTGPKQFTGGLSAEDLEDKSAAEIAAITATDFVDEDKTDLSGNGSYVVDFEGVAKGFLSDIIPYMFDLESEKDCKQCIGLLRNFYNYILHHNVCPEYQDDINAARLVCDLADRELFATRVVLKLLPGDFNRACSTLFGGNHSLVKADDEFAQNESKQSGVKVGLTSKGARQIFFVGVAACLADNKLSNDKEENKKLYLQQTVDSIENSKGMEVVAVIQPTREVIDTYSQVPGYFRPLGKLICKAWKLPDFVEDDLPPNKEVAGLNRSYEFFVEEQILASCFVGMKLVATVYTMSGGLTFIDNAFEVNCSFFTVLPNEMMRRWKEPREITREEQLAKEGNNGVNDGGETEDLD